MFPIYKSESAMLINIYTAISKYVFRNIVLWFTIKSTKLILLKSDLPKIVLNLLNFIIVIP